MSVHTAATIHGDVNADNLPTLTLSTASYLQNKISKNETEVTIFESYSQ